jgi:hypothetical protein
MERMLQRFAVLALFTLATTAHADGRKPYHSVWIGNYVCAQGSTALRLTIEMREKTTATARFEFGPNTINKNLPTGAYEMTGTVRVDAHDILDIKLVPDHWILQPNGYVMVGLTATSDHEQKTLDGRIDNPSCGAVALRRMRVERD